MSRFLILLSVLAMSVLPSPGVASERTDALLAKLGANALITIMRDEGLEYADELAQEMLPAGATDSWGSNIVRIYDERAMLALAQGAFARALDGDKARAYLGVMEAFFETPDGMRIVELEVSARRAMIDGDIEEAAKERARLAEQSKDDIFYEIEALVEAGDMLNANVVSAMNSNIQFYQGLVDGGAFRMSEAEILDDVRSQQDEIRKDTRDWLFGFLAMAYAPLPPGALEDYTEFTLSDAGQTLNNAIFEAFDTMYGEISYGLGLAVAREMKSENL